MYNPQTEKLISHASNEHKDFALYSRYDKFDESHIAIKIITDLFGIDWITEDHILFKFRHNANEEGITIRIDIHGVIELLLWAATL